MADEPEMSPDVAKAFVQIQKQFLAGLENRWVEIEQTDSADRRYAALHKLAGAAGGYGFDQLSLVARQAMNASPVKQDGVLKDLRALIHNLLPPPEDVTIR